MGEICNGWNTKLRQPFPSCEDGLRCVFNGKQAPIGQENVCIAPIGRKTRRKKEKTLKPDVTTKTSIET